MNDQINHWYLHVDLDAFFASVEQLDHPEYRGKPVIVGGKPEDRRGVVSTASYEARKFGVHSAMPTYQAYKLCPEGIYVYGNMRRYQELSYQIMTIFKDYSPDVDQMSIDEAFIDLTGTEKLFGPPEETAFKIKERVKKETGLTVSIGLAASKYIAKIASGYSKPDGFHFVKPGTETDFMLSLPLSKIWGAGEKTQEALKKNGIKTTRQLYEKDLNYLKFIFGENTGQYLYNAVRGQNYDTFKRVTKNHSLSTERTFAYDLHDVYTAETYLLELSHNVVFRLIKEKGYSKTITLKLRYDDFSTTSIQETQLNNIYTVDSFYENICRLFEKKYDTNRGIRLLGVGFDNIENEEGSKQLELFEDPNEKKHKIEKAILNLEAKHPEIKIQKARTISSGKKFCLTLFTFLMLFGSSKSSKIYAAEEKINTTEEKGAGTILPDTFDETETAKNGDSFFQWDINDSNKVDFILDGYWFAEFSNQATANFGNGNDFSMSWETPLFKQEVDLYTWLMLNNQFYFEADFADEFKKNTFALGYKGNGYLHSARISNRKITMPSVYSCDFFNVGVSGGDNQAPGVSLHFEDKDFSKWSGDFLLRYDMTESHSATFYGMNKVTDDSISLENYVYGQSYVFPEEVSNILENIKDIYVESTSGTITDSNGKKYTKLSSTQYGLYRSTNKLILSYSAKAIRTSNKIPTVLVTFEESDNVQQIISSLGNYSDSDSYLGKIQSYFSSNNSKDFNLENFAYKLENSIQNQKALIIQNSTGFSPFLVANTYDCGIMKDGDIFVQSKSSKSTDNNYSAILISEDINAGVEDLFNKNHQYVQIINNNYNQDDLQSPAIRYPFADLFPELYLNLQNENDLNIIVRSYSSISDFDIGTNASKGTVKVYINNIIDPLATYDSESGIVTLSKPVSETDKIYIVWQEDSSDYSGGSLAVGAGFTYKIKPNLLSDIALTMRWPVSTFTKYTTAENPLYGFTALSGGIDYSKEFGNTKLSVVNKSSIMLQTENPAGTLLAYKPENYFPQTYYLGKSDGFITNAIPQLNLPDETIILDENRNGTITSHAGSTDSKITGYKIPLEWDLSNLDSGGYNWASVDIKLNNGEYLKSSYQLEMAFLPAFEQSVNKNDYDIYLQLGINASTSFNGEDTSIIPTWKINELNDFTQQDLDITKNEWQTVKINLSKNHQALLNSNYDARLIIVQKGISNSGCIYTGPYEPHRQSLITSQDSEINVTTDCVTSNSPSSKELFSEQSYSSRIKWNILNPDKIITDEQSLISAVSYFYLADFSKYNSINFDFAYEALDEVTKTNNSMEPELTFILDSGSSSIENNGNIGLELKLYNIKNYISSEEQYHTVKVDISSNKVFIDDQLLDKETYSLFIDKTVIPNRQKIIFNTLIGDTLYTKGNWYINNLYYKDSSPYFNGQNNLTALIENKDVITKVNDFILLQNGMLQVSSTQSGSILDGKTQEITGTIQANANGNITFSNITFSSQIDTFFSSQTKAEDSINFISHSIKSYKPIFKVLSFDENYNYNKKDSNLKKSNTFKVDFSSLKVPVTLSGNFSASQGNSIQNQNGKLILSGNINSSKYTAKIHTQLTVSEKISTNLSNSNIEIDNYFTNWTDISTLEFSLGSEKASQRWTDYLFKFDNSFPLINLSPSLEYGVSSSYKNISGANFTDITKLNLSVPFTIKNNTFSANIYHTGVGLQHSDSINYVEDSNALFSLYPERTWFYTAIPFYELFDQNLGNKMMEQQTESNSDYFTYSAKYELGWKRRLFNNYTDVFIPSSSNISFNRDIKSDISLSDLYQLKVTATSTALNSFGKDSQLKLFKWYKQDEILNNISVLVKIPMDSSENIVFQTNFYTQLLFFIQNNNTLRFAADCSVATDNEWNTRFTVVFGRTAENPFLVETLEKWFNKEWNYIFKRKETLNIDIKNKDEINTQIYEYMHNADINFLKHFTVTLGIGTTFKYVEETGDSLGLNLSIGGKMEF